MSDEKITRRGFVGALAGALAGMAAAAAPAAAAETKARRRAARGARATTTTAATRAELQNQKKYVAQALQKLRGYKLASGSDVAFAFRARKPPRRSGERVS